MSFVAPRRQSCASESPYHLFNETTSQHCECTDAEECLDSPARFRGSSNSLEPPARHVSDSLLEYLAAYGGSTASTCMTFQRENYPEGGEYVAELPSRSLVDSPPSGADSPPSGVDSPTSVLESPTSGVGSPSCLVGSPPSMIEYPSCIGGFETAFAPHRECSEAVLYQRGPVLAQPVPGPEPIALVSSNYEAPGEDERFVCSSYSSGWRGQMPAHCSPTRESAGGICSFRNRVFVGGLTKQTTATSLMEYMSLYGKVKGCDIILCRKTGLSKGFGFCYFHDVPDESFFSRIHYLDGKIIGVSPYKPRAPWTRSRRATQQLWLPSGTCPNSQPACSRLQVPQMGDYNAMINDCGAFGHISQRGHPCYSSFSAYP